ncbi:NusG domain II-containing protein [[Clostridium] aminophilum]|uniref:NusG domain II-containing protein n=1 Tax=[Clostridium] aminophilum TaxID=1526 RepID=UPI00332A35BB
MTMNRQKKNTLLLLAAVLLISALSWAVYGFRTGAFQKKDTKIVEIQVDGSRYGRYPLDQDTEFEIQSIAGHVHFIIKDGKAAITESTCPDKVCVHTGWISQSGELIVCLPNQVVVTVL